MSKLLRYSDLLGAGAVVLVVVMMVVPLCNARHSLEGRLARWLLLSRDWLDSYTIPLTHDLFSMMLGVRRMRCD